MTDKTKKVRTKNPGTAAFLSVMVWPGSGNIYNGKFRHGILWIFSAMAGWMLYVVQLGFFAAALISIYLFATLHAYKQARKINVFRTGSPEYEPEMKLAAKNDDTSYGLREERGDYAQSER